MNVLGMIASGFLWAYAILVTSLAIKDRKNPNKTQREKVSEIVYGIAFGINGFILLFLFRGQNLSLASENILYGGIIIAYTAILAFLWGDVLYTKLRINRHPELLNSDAKFDRNFDSYFTKIELEYKNKSKGKSKDIVKDLTRKALHLVILAVVILTHELSFKYGNIITKWGFTPTAFQNSIYEIAAFFFIFMFTTADIVRVHNFKLLPDWSHGWYGKSVEVSTEKYSYISSVPFLLALMLFIKTPFAVILCAAIVSCISDAVASVVGKSIGKHKMTGFGRYPHKSYEGLFAGASSAFIGIILVFYFFPVPGVTEVWQFIFGLIAAVSFIYIDAFSKYIVDNVLNTIVPGLIIGLLIAIFIL